MLLIVQKYGGSSVATTELILNVAKRVKKKVEEGNELVVIVSAQGKTTDNLLNLAKSINTNPSKREIDMLISTGEQQSSALLAITLEKIGVDAISLTGEQAGIFASNSHGNAKILSINTKRIGKELEYGKVVVIAGFQGINENGDISTLGRGGSDTTAVSVAAAIKADKCEIYSDVDGIYTADPRIVESAVKLEQISYDEMLELASMGAKVLHNRAVEVAKNNNVTLMSGSSFNDVEGTYVKHIESIDTNNIKGITGYRNIDVVTLENFEDNVSKLYEILGKNNITTDMIHFINKSVIFSIKKNDRNDVEHLINQNFKNAKIKIFEDYAKLSIVGLGLMSNSKVIAEVFKTLEENKVKVYFVNTSELKISMVIDKDNLDRITNLLHERLVK
ncbi:MAG: aspartate kinase [Clostridiales bacterium]|nr:aspartate kinase [Clostridiales bacterium]